MPKQISADLISKDLLKRLEDVIKLTAQVNVNIDKLTSSVIEGQKAFDKNATSQKDLKDRTTQLSTAEKQLLEIQKSEAKITAAQTDTGKALIAQKVKEREVTRQLTEEAKKAQGVHSGFVDGIKKSITQFALMAGAIAGSVKGLIEFGKAVVRSSGELQDKWEVRIAAAKEGVRVFLAQLSDGTGWNNFFTSASKSIAAVKEFTEKMDRLKDLNRSNAIQQAEARKELAKMEIAWKSATDPSKKAELLDVYLAKVEEMANKNKDLAKQEMDATADRIAAQTDLGRGIVKNLARNVGSYEDLIQKGNEYNELQKELRDTEKSQYEITSDGISVFHDKTAQIEEIKNKIKELGSSEGLGKLAKGFSTLTAEGKDGKAMFDELVSSMIKYADADAAVFEENIKAQVARQKLTEELNGQKKANDELIKSEKEALEVEKERAKLTEDRANMASSTSSKSGQIQNNVSDVLNGITANPNNILYNKDLNDFQLTEDEKVKIAEATYQALSDLANGYANLQNAKYDAQIQNIEEERDRAIKAAKDKGQNTDKIEAEYDKKIRKVQRERAKQNKKISQFENALNTAVAFMKQWKETPPPAGTPLLIAVATAGALQAAVIAKEPLPALWSGGKVDGSGNVIVGDPIPGSGKKGQHELVMLPNGEGFLTPNRPTLMNLPAGSKVFNEQSQETKAALSQFNDSRIVSELQMIRKSSGTQRNITPEGMIEINKHLKSRQILLNERFR
jgi:hypothetical protein